MKLVVNDKYINKLSYKIVRLIRVDEDKVKVKYETSKQRCFWPMHEFLDTFKPL